MKATVIKSTGSWYTLRLENGEVVEARLRGKFRLQGTELTNPIAVGDTVEVNAQGSDDSVIEAILPRKNYLLRQATKASSRYQIVASNLDKAFVIATFREPRTSTGFIDRFLVTTAHYGIESAIVFNKTDLYGDDPEFEEMVETYRACGYTVLTTTCIRGELSEEFVSHFRNKTSLLFGHSGVGKSTILNLLTPAATQATADISVQHQKGKHTTTFAEMFDLDGGGYVIDTPGVKEFGLEVMENWKLAHYFNEFKPYIGNCKYNTCLHMNEPHCGVMEAFANDLIPEFRYANYLNMLEDLMEMNQNPDYSRGGK